MKGGEKWMRNHLGSSSGEAILEMKHRGYCPELIEAEKEKLGRLDDVNELIGLIEKAFAEVKLGNGIGLHEAQGLDDYADTETCAKLRAKDETNDWRKISSEELNACSSSLSFFDAEGMRFHLPAFLISELKGEYHCGTAFHLTQSLNLIGEFSALSKEQRIAVRLFLLHALVDSDYEFEWSDIRHALDSYWIWPE